MSSELDFESKKEQLLELEKIAKRRIQESSEVVKSDALKALKIGLVAGGVLFVGYKLTKAITTSKKEKTTPVEPARRPAREVSRLYSEAQNEPHPTKKGPSVLRTVVNKAAPMISGFLLQLAMDTVQKNFLKNDPAAEPTRKK